MGGIIEYRANGGTARDYLAPGDKGKGVVVLQEYWGLVPHIQDICDRFAAEGYTALAPDLFDGTVTSNPDEAFRLLMALNIDEMARKLSGAVAALHAHGAAGKVGIVGFCMGGQLALYAATAQPDAYGAVVDFYGIHPKVTPDYAALEAPVLGFFAEQDGFVAPAAGREIKANVEKAGGRMDIHVYPGQHAFFNDTRPEVYDKASADDAWQKTLAFLAANL
jgi:carboxymethylenebutenolidase